jgi:katanin p60 ATPase-containing subunit A1
MKTELLIQMDGIARTSDLVFVLAATNLPWELDQAMLRRLEKRILVGLPCQAARRHILEEYLADRIGEDVCLDELAAQLDGYSGSDIMLVAKEAAMQPLRRLLLALEARGAATQQAAHAQGTAQDGAGETCKESQGVVMEVVSRSDIQRALVAVKSTVHKYAQEYARFTADFGSQMSSV